MEGVKVAQCFIIKVDQNKDTLHSFLGIVEIHSCWRGWS